MYVSVFGLGKLGSCLAGVLADAGHQVVGIDSDEKAAARILSRTNPEPGFADLDLSRLRVTTVAAQMCDTEMSFVIVPTPSKPEGCFDSQFLETAIKDICRWAEPGHICVVVSTVSPGTIRRIAATLQPANVELIYSPLFVALGSVVRDLRNPDLRLIGASEPGRMAGEKVAEVLWSIDRVKPTETFQLTWEEAEIAKIAVNCALVQKIAFANMIAAGCRKLEYADPVKVLAAVGADSRIGGKLLRPGGPPGGTCLPRDSFALCEFLERVRADSRIPKAVIDFNIHQVADVIRWCEHYQTVAILGLAYKPGTPVTDESLGIKVASRLASYGRDVVCHDPMATPMFHWFADPKQTIAAADAVLIATPWPEYAGIDTMGKPTLDVWGVQ